MSSQPSPRLTDFDSPKVQELFQSYARRDAARVAVVIHGATQTFGVRVTVSLRISAPSLPRLRRVKVAVISGLAPSRKLTSTAWRPATLIDLQADFNGSKAIAHSESGPGQSSIYVMRPWYVSSRHPLRVSFQLDDAFKLFAGDGSLRTFMLGLRVTLTMNQAAILTLTHPSEYSLRTRLDNSEYHSLATGVAQDNVQKVGFFPSDSVELRYLYGAHGESSFYGLVRAPLVASFGLIAAGLTIAFDKVGHTALSSTTLFFALLPPLAQLASGRRLFYKSADIRGRDLAALVGVFSAAIYVPLVSFSVIALIDISPYRNLAQGLAYAAATILGLLAATIAVAVREHVIPAHFCDGCVKRIHWRRRAKLHLDSRRTLCQSCYVKVKAS